MLLSTLLDSSAPTASDGIIQGRLASPKPSDGVATAGYFFEDSFTDDSCSAIFLDTMPVDSDSKTKAPPNDLPAYLKHLWSVPLLTAQQQHHCFRKLNYLKFLSARNQALAASCMGCARMLDDVADWDEQACKVRNLIVESNLRLVVSLAKKYAAFASDEFDEMVCVGNAAVVRAVDLFDYRRGVCFSTYAYHAIQHSIFAAFRKEGRIKSRFAADGSEAIESASADAGASELAEIRASEARIQVMELIQNLDERDQQIVMARFGIDREAEGVAFHVIAKEIGLSTTRTAQLFRRSMEKLRTFIAP